MRHVGLGYTNLEDTMDKTYDSNDYEMILELVGLASNMITEYLKEISADGEVDMSVKIPMISMCVFSILVGEAHGLSEADIKSIWLDSYKMIDIIKELAENGADGADNVQRYAGNNNFKN